ncbi:MAG TPA: FAD-dependent monooxygenase [Ohtaekwangia sp.]|nr:FAD-dependent monooxygenase [Ohtaekwangia sp.]
MPDHQKNSFAIVGGGIGGLTLAIAMQRNGYQVVVYENAPEMKLLGAGLGLSANAIKALMAIGLHEDILEKGKILRTMRIKSSNGRVLSESDSEKVSARYGAVNNFTIHRAELHEVLLRRLAPGTLQLNKGCTDYIDEGSSIRLLFSDGSSATADYVIACDGIHSIFRKKLVPGSVPRYAGYTCWRAVTDKLPAHFNTNETSETWGRGSRFGIVPLTNNRVYWFACLNAPQNDPAMRAYTTTDLLRHFGNFHTPVPQLINGTDSSKLIWADIIDVAPLTRFAFGRIVLMGDTAHATTPNMGQGACMAIEDAAVLVNCLAHTPSVPEAFQAFESRRIPRTTKIVNRSLQLGRVAQLENPLLMALRNTALRLTPPRVAEKQVEFLYEISFA